MTLGTRSTTQNFDIEVAASGNTQVVRSKMAARRLGTHSDPAPVAAPGSRFERAEAGNVSLRPS